MFRSCKKAISIFYSSLEEHGLLQGVSDIIVVKHKTNTYKSTQFFACFGANSVQLREKNVKISVNKTLINNISFKINKYGYLHPNSLNSEDLAKLCLRFGKNTIEYHAGSINLSAEIYLYSDNDRLLVSDFDGTATKNDLGGLYNNYLSKDYLHDGYHELVNGVADNGYKIVWMTMRSLPLYNFSKKYIAEHIKQEGPLLMEPEQFFQAVKKQVMKNTGNIKANVMRTIRQLFPQNINPFIGGLGNRENDAIAYLHAGIPIQCIYIINKQSSVHKLDRTEHELSYKQILKEISKHFPKHRTFYKSKHRYLDKYQSTSTDHSSN